MELKLIGAVFITIFLAELGDKTQIATLLFASKQPGQILSVFLGALLALSAATVMAVLLGGQLAQWINPRWLSYGAGVLFIVIGGWTLWTA